NRHLLLLGTGNGYVVGEHATILLFRGEDTPHTWLGYPHGPISAIKSKTVFPAIRDFDRIGYLVADIEDNRVDGGERTIFAEIDIQGIGDGKRKHAREQFFRVIAQLKRVRPAHELVLYD